MPTQALHPRHHARAAILLSALALGACGDAIPRHAGFIAGDHEMELPVGIGPEQNELRLSPCACIEIPLAGPPPGATPRFARG